MRVNNVKILNLGASGLVYPYFGGKLNEVFICQIPDTMTIMKITIASMAMKIMFLRVLWNGLLCPYSEMIVELKHLGAGFFFLGGGIFSYIIAIF